MKNYFHQNSFTRQLKSLSQDSAPAKNLLNRALAFALAALAVLAVLPLLSASAQAGTCTVTSLADSGVGTLRDHITNPTCDVINFGVGGVITLTSGQLTIDRNLTINGPGANLLTVGRSASAAEFRIFQVISGLTVNISGLTISSGRVSFDNGGGIYNDGNLTVTNSAISNNFATFHGGGIINGGNLTVTNSTFSGNYSAGGNGGGIGNWIYLTVKNSTFTSNYTGTDGGGIWSQGNATIANSTFSGNIADNGGGGLASYGPITVTHCTLSDNLATYFGGAIYIERDLSLRGSLVAENAGYYGGPDIRVYGTVVASYSLIGSDQGNGIANGSNGNIVGVSASALQLGPLADNGGPTRIRALLSGSPAIDAGICTDGSGNPVATDQRGVARPQGSSCDIGAYEYRPPYAFSGFFQPVDNLPTENVVRAGSAIPVKFSLGGNRGLDIFAAGFPASQQIACNNSAPVSDIEETVAAGGSSLTYDPATDQYSYIWKTNTAWKNTCRQLAVKLNDGSSHIANFQFK